MLFKLLTKKKSKCDLVHCTYKHVRYTENKTTILPLHIFLHSLSLI